VCGERTGVLIPAFRDLGEAGKLEVPCLGTVGEAGSDHIDPSSLRRLIRDEERATHRSPTRTRRLRGSKARLVYVDHVQAPGMPPFSNPSNSFRLASTCSGSCLCFKQRSVRRYENPARRSKVPRCSAVNRSP